VKKKKKKLADEIPSSISGHAKLERRRLLNAQFAFDGSELLLSQFSDADMVADNEQVRFEQTGSSFVITLSEGTWSGTDGMGVTGSGTNTLTGSAGAINSIIARSTTATSFDVEFGNIGDGMTAFAGDFSFEKTASNANFGSMTQDGSTTINHGGILEISAVDDITLGEDNDFTTVDVQNAASALFNDVDDFDALSIQTTGDTTVTAGGTISLDNAQVGGSLTATTSTGDINIDGSGDLNLSTISTAAGAVDVETTGDVRIGSVSASGNVDITTTGGSINDLQDDLLVDVSSGGTTQLNALDEVGGDVAATVDTFGKLELADNSVVEIDTTDGDVAIRGVGSLTLEDVQATNGTVNVVAADNIAVVEVMGSSVVGGDGVFLGAGEDGSGSLSLDGDVTTTSPTGRVLLQSPDSVTQVSGVISTNGLLLDGNDFDLNGDNVVSILAANLTGDLIFENSVALVFGGLTYTSICADVTINGVTVGRDLNVNVADRLTQTQAVSVGRDADFVASDEICLTDPGNDFGGTVAADAATIELVDVNDLTVGLLDANDNIFLQAGAGVSGLLTLDGNLIAGSQILLQSSGGVTQSVGTSIDTNELLLGGNAAAERTGDFSLTGNNVVNRLAANVNDDLTFNNTTSVVVGNLEYASVCGTTEAIVGVLTGSDLDITVDGDLKQEARILVQGNTVLEASGNIGLTNNNNEFVNAVTVDSSTSTPVTVEISDRNTLRVNAITASDDIFLRAGVTTIGSLELDGSLTTTSATGQVLLQSSGGVSQNVGFITTSELLLGSGDPNEGSGTFDLTASNRVDNLAANLQGDLDFSNVVDLNIADLTYSSACSPNQSIVGLMIGSNLTLTIDGAINQTAGVIVVGDASITSLSDEVCLNDPTNDFMGNVSVSGTTVELADANDLMTSAITVDNDIFLRAGAGGVGAGELILNGSLTTTAAGGQVLLQSSDGVTQAVGVITTNDLLLGGNDAVEGSGDFNLNALNQVNNLASNVRDNLTFNNLGDVMLANLTYTSVCGTMENISGLTVGNDLALDVEGSITQSAAVDVDGGSNLRALDEICLDDPANDFDGTVTASGTTVEIVDLNALIAGVISADNDIFLGAGAGGTGGLTLAGDLTTSDPAGQVLLQSSAGVAQNSGVITTNDLLLGGNLAAEGSGSFNLSGMNVVNNLAADLNGNLVFNNVSSLDLASLTYSSICGTTEAIVGVDVKFDTKCRC